MRPLRLGQEHPDPRCEPARAHPAGGDSRPRRVGDGTWGESGQAPDRGRHGVPVLQPLPAHDDAPEHHAGAPEGEGDGAGRGREARPEPAGARADPRPGRRLPGQYLWRPAAAGGHRPGSGHAAQDHAVRRADLGARSRDDQRGARGHDRPGQGGHDHDGGDARDGVRPSRRQPRGVHGLRAGGGGAAPGRFLRQTEIGPGEGLPLQDSVPLTYPSRRIGMLKRLVAVVIALAVLGAGVAPALAETTLEKVARTETLTIGTRTGSPPFAYVNSKNEWVGFSIDLVEQLVKPSIEKKIGKMIKIEKKESTPPTRIPLLSSNAVDLIAGTMTDTRTRRDSVDFSLTFFVTGAQFLVKKGSPIKGIKSIDGKRIGAQQGSTTARVIREKAPRAVLREFPDQPAGFQALVQGQVDAYTSDGIQLAGLKAKSLDPAQWDIVGDFFSYEPYGMAMRKGDADFRNVVNGGLMEGIESGKFFEIYGRWFGVKGEVPYPMASQVRSFMLLQVVPK